MKELLDYRQAALLLGLKVATLQSWVCRGRIPHVRLAPRVVRFDPDMLGAWLDARKVNPTGKAPVGTKAQKVVGTP